MAIIGIPTIIIETTSGGVIIAAIIAITTIAGFSPFCIVVRFKTPARDNNALNSGTSNKNPIIQAVVKNKLRKELTVAYPVTPNPFEYEYRYLNTKGNKIFIQKTIPSANKLMKTNTPIIISLCTRCDEIAGIINASTFQIINGRLATSASVPHSLND